MEKEYYSVEEFANRFSIHPETIRKAIKAGRIQAVRIGIGKRSPYRISRHEIDRISVMSFDEIIGFTLKEGE